MKAGAKVGRDRNVKEEIDASQKVSLQVVFRMPTSPKEHPEKVLPRRRRLKSLQQDDVGR